ncbi:MAG TPA: DinB family protein [Tepidiformaceae bacterium]|nr:DinB family protein [Tepidiformaceae bacterium]
MADIAMPTTLAPFYEGWGAFQSLLVEAVAPLTDEQLMLCASGSLRPAWMLAAHIAGARDTWWHEVLREGGPWDRAKDKVDRPGAPFLHADQLVTALIESWALIEESLNRWSPTMLADEFTRDRGGQTWRMTRQWTIWHVLEHDLVHGGELFLTLGMHGIAVPDF